MHYFTNVVPTDFNSGYFRKAFFLFVCLFLLLIGFTNQILSCCRSHCVVGRAELKAGMMDFVFIYQDISIKCKDCMKIIRGIDKVPEYSTRVIHGLLRKAAENLQTLYVVRIGKFSWNQQSDFTPRNMTCFRITWPWCIIDFFPQGSVVLIIFVRFILGKKKSVALWRYVSVSTIYYPHRNQLP